MTYAKKLSASRLSLQQSERRKSVEKEKLLVVLEPERLRNQRERQADTVRFIWPNSRRWTLLLDMHPPSELSQVDSHLSKPT
jgi:hypothetical protein